MFDRFRRTSRAAASGPKGDRVVRSGRDRRALVKEIERAIEELGLRAATPGAVVVEVQLVIQVCAAAGYAAWKADRESAWRKQGGSWTTASWPSSLDADAFGALLLPLPAGRMGLAAGKHPRPVAAPLFTWGTPREGRYEDLVLGLVARWTASAVERPTARLAPPVVEVVQGGRVERRLVDFGLWWPLPAPDGV